METTIKGKGLTLGGSIVSVVFTSLGIILGFFFRLALTDTEVFKESFVESMTASDPNITTADATQFAEDMIPTFEIMSNLFIFVGLIFLVWGIVSIILSRKVNYNNKKAIGISFILFAVMHILFLRLLAFILILIGGIQILSSKEIDSSEEHTVIDESETY